MTDAKNSPRAPKPAFGVDDLVAAYFDNKPDPDNPAQRVSFGTSGHRGNSLAASFTERHILAIVQAVCDYRREHGIHGPLFMGKDTHALSAPALESALEVLAANDVETRIQRGDAPTATPLVSRSILVYNAVGHGRKADGIVITPSHNPPEDGGLKYNEWHGGPAGTAATGWIESRANIYLSEDNKGIKRLVKTARKAPCVIEDDFIDPYVADLENVVNMRAIAASGLRLGIDPLGGSSLPLWEPVAKRYGIALTVVNSRLDPLFGFMPPDHDGKIRMDCSSPMAMAGLIGMAKDFDIAFGNDPDADRHGIVTRQGLMNPNQYLCAAVWYLLQNRPAWPTGAGVGKTCVTTALLDRISESLGRKVFETPVGFKWFVDGMHKSELVFGGEESAGASFLRLDGKPWSTDKDGIIMNLLAAEMMAVTSADPARIYSEASERLGKSYYARIDAPATAAEKAILKKLTPEAIKQKELAGDPINSVITRAPGNGEPIGGLKVATGKGWFAARPSGTEDLYKIYAESFDSPGHLARLQQEARNLVAETFAGQGA